MLYLFHVYCNFHVFPIEIVYAYHTSYTCCFSRIVSFPGHFSHQMSTLKAFFLFACVIVAASALIPGMVLAILIHVPSGVFALLFLAPIILFFP